MIVLQKLIDPMLRSPYQGSRDEIGSPDPRDRHFHWVDSKRFWKSIVNSF